MQRDGRAAGEGGVLSAARKAARRGPGIRGIPCALVAIALILAPGCAGAPPKAEDGRGIPRDRPRVALLPLENLTAKAEAGEAMTRIFFTELARTGAVEMVEPGSVDAAIDGLHIRATGSLSSEQFRSVGDMLGARYAFVGSVLESGKISTPDGEVPVVGVTLRMVETKSARVVWAAMRFRSGDDKETVFGWGRVRSGERLATELASEMFREFHKIGRAAPPPSEDGGGSK